MRDQCAGSLASVQPTSAGAELVANQHKKSQHVTDLAIIEEKENSCSNSCARSQLYGHHMSTDKLSPGEKCNQGPGPASSSSTNCSAPTPTTSYSALTSGTPYASPTSTTSYNSRNRSRSIDVSASRAVDRTKLDFIIKVTDEEGEIRENEEIKQEDKQNKPDREEWWEDFDLLIYHPVGIRLFTEFLTKEFSEENIIFWKACEEYKTLKDGSARSQKAQEIFTKHLAEDASQPVNIDSGARQTASDAVSTAVSERFGRIDIFHTAQKQIYNLMKMDSFQRFLQSDIYKDYMEKDMKRSQTELNSKTGKYRKDAKKWSLSTLGNIIGKVKYKENQERDGSGSGSGLHTRTYSSPDIALLSQTCPDIEFTRIVLPDGSTAVLCPKQGESLQDMIETLLRRRGETRDVVAFLENGEPLDSNQRVRSVILEWKTE